MRTTLLMLPTHAWITPGSSLPACATAIAGIARKANAAETVTISCRPLCSESQQA